MVLSVDLARSKGMVLCRHGSLCAYGALYVCGSLSSIGALYYGGSLAVFGALKEHGFAQV